jgi:hypothetical protein
MFFGGLLSTSQVVGVAIFFLSLFMLFYLRKREASSRMDSKR